MKLVTIITFISNNKLHAIAIYEQNDRFNSSSKVARTASEKIKTLSFFQWNTFAVE